MAFRFSTVRLLPLSAAFRRVRTNAALLATLKSATPDALVSCIRVSELCLRMIVAFRVEISVLPHLRTKGAPPRRSTSHAWRVYLASTAHRLHQVQDS